MAQPKVSADGLFMREIEYKIGAEICIETPYDIPKYSSFFRGDLVPESRIKLNLLKSIFDRQFSLNGRFNFPNWR